MTKLINYERPTEVKPTSEEVKRTVSHAPTRKRARQKPISPTAQQREQRTGKVTVSTPSDIWEDITGKEIINREGETIDWAERAPSPEEPEYGVGEYSIARLMTHLDEARAAEKVEDPQKLPEGKTVPRSVNYVTMPGVTGVPETTMSGESRHIKEARNKEEAKMLSRLQKKTIAEMPRWASEEQYEIASADPEDVDWSDAKLIATAQKALAASAGNITSIIGGALSTGAWKFHPLAGAIGSTLYFNYMYEQEKYAITRACLQAGIPRKYWEDKAHIYALMAGFWEFSGTSIEWAMYFIGGRSISQMTAPVRNKALRAMIEIAKGYGMEFTIEGTIAAWKINTLSTIREDYQRDTGEYLDPRKLRLPTSAEGVEDQILRAGIEGGLASILPGIIGTGAGYMSWRATQAWDKVSASKWADKTLPDLQERKTGPNQTITTDKLLTKEKATEMVSNASALSRQTARTKIQKNAARLARLDLKQAIMEKSREYDNVVWDLGAEYQRTGKEYNAQKVRELETRKAELGQELINAQAKAWAEILASRRIKDPIQAKKERDSRVADILETDVRGRPTEIMEADYELDKTGIEIAPEGAIRVEKRQPYTFDVLTRLYQAVAMRRKRRNKGGEGESLTDTEMDSAKEEGRTNALLAYEEVSSLKNRSAARYSKMSENQVLDNLLTAGEISLFEQLQNEISWRRDDILQEIKNKELSTVEELIGDNRSTIESALARKILDASDNSIFNPNKLFSLLVELKQQYPEILDGKAKNISALKLANPETITSIVNNFLPLMVYDAFSPDVTGYRSEKSHEVLQQTMEGMYDIQPRDIYGTNFNWLFYFDIQGGVKKLGYLNPETGLFHFPDDITGEVDYDMVKIEEWVRNPKREEQTDTGLIPVLLLGNNTIFVDGGKTSQIEKAVEQYGEAQQESFRVETAAEVVQEYRADELLSDEGRRVLERHFGTRAIGYLDSEGTIHSEEISKEESYPRHREHFSETRLMQSQSRSKFRVMGDGTVLWTGKAPTAKERQTVVENFDYAKDEHLDFTRMEGRGVFQQRAWHGTRHPILEGGKFSLDKVGTGTGAFGEGFGIYFAEEKTVGKAYRPDPELHLDGERITADWKHWDEFMEISSPISIAKKSLLTAYSRGETENLINAAQKIAGEETFPFVEGTKQEEAQATKRKAIEWLDQNRDRISIEEIGAIYEVDIPEDVKPRLMEWEGDTTQQTIDGETVYQKIRKGLIEKGLLTEENADNILPTQDTRGEAMYKTLSNYFFDGDPKATSEFLASIGIPGNKYLDAGSRFGKQEGEPTHNFVIWNEGVLDRISTLKKNEQAMEDLSEEQATFYQRGVPTYDHASWDTSFLSEKSASAKYKQEDVQNWVNALPLTLGGQCHLHIGSDAGFKFLDTIKRTYPVDTKYELFSPHEEYGHNRMATLRSQGGQADTVTVLLDEVTDLESALAVAKDACSNDGVVAFIGDRAEGMGRLIDQYFGKQNLKNGLLLASEPKKGDFQLEQIVRWHTNRKQNVYEREGHPHQAAGFNRIGSILRQMRFSLGGQSFDPFSPIASLLEEYTTDEFKKIPIRIDPDIIRAHATPEGIYVPEGIVHSRTYIHEIGHMLGLKEIEKQVDDQVVDNVEVWKSEGLSYINALRKIKEGDSTSPGMKTFIELYLKAIEHSEEYLPKLDVSKETRDNVKKYVNTEDAQEMGYHYLYGLANLHEFYASAVSYPDFMSFLSSLEGVREGPSSPNALDNIKRTFTEFLVGEEKARGDFSVSPTRRMGFQELIERVFFIGHEGNYTKNLGTITDETVFQQLDKGRTTFTRDGRAIMEFFRSADIDTPAHELAHVFFTTLSEPDVHTIVDYLSGKTSEANPQGRTISAETLLHWIKDPSSYPNLSSAQQKDVQIAQEYFANNFVRYLREGKAPTPRMRMLLATFNDELKRIYKNIADIPMAEKPISKKVRKIYDKMLDAESALEGPKKYVKIDGVRYTVNRSPGRTYKAQMLLKYLRKAHATIDGLKKELWDYARPLMEKHSLEVEALIERVEKKEDIVPTMDKLDKLEARDTALIQEKKLRELRDTLTSMEMNRMPQRYADAIREVLSDISLRRDATVKRKTELAEKTARYIKEYYDKHGIEPNMPQNVLNNVEDLGKKSIYEMDPEEIQILHELVKHYDYLALTKSKLRQMRLLKKLDKAITEVRGSLREHGEVGEPKSYDIKGLPKWRQWAKWFLWDRTKKIENLVFYMDGCERGPLTEIFFDNFDRAKDKRESIVGDWETSIVSWLDALDINPKEWSTSMQIPGESFDSDNYIELKGMLKTTPKSPTPTRSTMRITKAQRVALYLYSLNRNARRHLLEGAIIDKNTPTAKYRFESDLHLESVLKDITPEEQQLAHKILKYYENVMKPLINETSVSLVGYELATEENYFPLFVEWLTRKQGEALYKAELNTQVESFLRRIIERSGFLQERTEAVNPIYLPDVFAAMHDNIHEASLYVAYAEPLRIAKAVLWDAGQEPSDETGGAAIPGFIQLMRDSKWGDESYNSLKEHVTKIEGDVEFTVVSERMGRKALENMTYAILGWNMNTAALQPVSYLMIFNEMDSKYALQGLKKLPNSLKESMEELSRLDPEFKRRFQGYMNKDVGEISSSVELRQTLLGKDDLFSDIKNWRDVGLKAAFYRAGKGHSLDWLKLQDARTISHIYEAVKAEQAELHPNATQAEMWNYVKRRMRYLVRQTQPIYNVQDRPEIFNSRNFVDSVLVKFMTQLNSNRNQAEKAYRMWKAGKITGAEATARIANATAVNSMAVGAIRRFTSGLAHTGRTVGEGGLYEEEELSWAEKRLIDTLNGVSAQYPVVRNIMDIATTQIEYGTFVSSQRRGLFSEVFFETGRGLAQTWQGSPRDDALTSEEWMERLIGLSKVMEQINNTLVGYAPRNVKKIYNIAKGFGAESVELMEDMNLSLPSSKKKDKVNKLIEIDRRPKENK